MPWRAIALLVTSLLCWAPAVVRAEPQSYALVIGANRGGHGQAPLRFASEDARRVAELLVELGRTRADRVRLLLEPTPAAIQQALAQLGARLGEHARAGESSKLFFYYSGHARARSLSLAGGELPLEALRQALLALPSTLTVAVLDACQSGAISGVKGATPTSDFSSGAIFDLHNEGVAVLASSTAAEFSQESFELGASYFTHHLVTGLRGAADGDADGTVSLDEVYRYAYQNTLSDTLRTRVGSQHATLETELKGHGSVPLTFTGDADSQLRLPESIAGRVVVQRYGRGVVLAELEKTQGTSLTLALPHGAYEVLVRRHDALSPQSCAITLARTTLHTLDTHGCPVVEQPALASKGEGAQFERWFVELGISRRFARDDAYVQTLEEFHFEPMQNGQLAADRGNLTPLVLAGVGFTRHFALLGRIERLRLSKYERVIQAEAGAQTSRFEWRTWSFALGARGRWPLFHERFVPFGELDLGLGVASSHYQGPDQDESYHGHFGPVLRASLGATLHMFWRMGLILSAGYDYAPVLENLVGDTHDDGGFQLGLGLRLRGLAGGS
jgi:Caspase domain